MSSLLKAKKKVSWDSWLHRDKLVWRVCYKLIAWLSGDQITQLCDPINIFVLERNHVKDKWDYRRERANKGELTSLQFLLRSTKWIFIVGFSYQFLFTFLFKISSFLGLKTFFQRSKSWILFRWIQGFYFSFRIFITAHYHLVNFIAVL